MNNKRPFNNNRKERTTVWVGELDGFEDEEYFKLIFNHLYNLKSIKIIKKNGIKTDYAFIELQNSNEAQNLIDTYNNKQRPLSNK